MIIAYLYLFVKYAVVCGAINGVDVAYYKYNATDNVHLETDVSDQLSSGV